MTVTIRTFPNKLDRSIVEIETFPAGQSLTTILQSEIPNFRVMATPPIEVLKNGSPWLPGHWDLPLAANDELDITIRPRDPITVVISVIAAVVGGVVVANQMAPADNYNQTVPDGSPIYDANAQGNRIQMMGVVPELFGTHGTFPSLVNPAHRYFYNDDEYILLMTMVSRGFLQMTNDDIQIGNTPIAQYAGDIDTQIKDPGQDVTAHPAYLNVYTSPEVGATSGTGGIELEGAINSITPVKTHFTGKTMTIYQELDGVNVAFWPPEWEDGDRLDISGTPGAKEISESHSYGGWRGEAETTTLNFWAQNPDLHDCKRGDYIQYPQYDGGKVVWVNGMIDAKFTGIHNNVEFQAVRVLDANGDRMEISDIPSGLRNQPIKFLGKDDGTYRIISHSDKNGELAKLYPNKSTTMAWWTGYTNPGNHTSVRITATESLPGKPVGIFYPCPVNEVTNQLRVDIRFPEGIGHLEDNGSIKELEMRVMLQWREDENSSWKNQEFKRKGATKDQLANTVHINLGKYVRPQFRCYRITGKADDTRTWDKIELVRLKSVLESKTSYPDGTTLAVRIRGTNALSRSAENKLFCVPTRLLHVPKADGSWTGDNYNSKANMVATNDIAPVLRYISHEVGLSDANLGQDELLRLHEIWQQRGDHFAAVFDNKDTFWEAIKRLLAVGYSVPTLEFGQIIPVRDEPRTVYDHMYQPDNMTGKGLARKDKLFDYDEPDGIEVEYFSKQSWKPETVLCLLPGDKGTKPRRVKAFGVIDYAQAWQFGMRERRLARYVRTEYSWQTEMDGFNSRYMDFVALADDVPGYSQNGQLVDWRPLPGGAWLKLDRDLEWTENETHWLALRKPDGRLSGAYRASRLTAFDEVQITGQLDFTPDLSGRQEFPLWMFGTNDAWSFPAQVTSIKPQGTEKVSLAARNYDLRVYIDDDSKAPPVGNDPVLGMRLTASGSGDRVTADRNVQHFKPADKIRLSVTGSEYLIRSLTSTQLRLNNLDGTPASLSFSLQPITITLTARG